MAKNETEDLVQPQGVDAGEQDLDAPREESARDVRSGGDVSKAPDRREGLIGYPSVKSEEGLTGNPGSPEPHDQEKDGSSGQDEGLMS